MELLLVIPFPLAARSAHNSLGLQIDKQFPDSLSEALSQDLSRGRVRGSVQACNDAVAYNRPPGCLIEPKRRIC